MAEPHFRASFTLEDIVTKLSPLQNLLGRWVRKGFNLISVPDANDPFKFLLLLSATWESIEFTPIGGIILNRGADQDNLTFTGLNYMQQVSDAVSNGALHVEAGQWLTIPPVPATPTATPPIPEEEATLIRQATILHGNSLLAKGISRGSISLPPFPVEDAIPTPKGQGIPANVLTAIQNRFNNPALSALPPNIDASFVKNPNLYLERGLQALTQKKQSLKNPITATFIISATLDNPPNGGIINMPFLSNNTKVTSSMLHSGSNLLSRRMEHLLCNYNIAKK